MKNKEAIEIYVHIPFCQRKCDYCDFVSSVCSKDTQKKYFDALEDEIRLKSEITGRVPVVSCFFGGGTPSYPDGSYIEKTLIALKNAYDFLLDSEITIEVNPASADFEKLSLYKSIGINRLSIGLQSANDLELKKLTRLHDYEGFLKTYEDAKKAGFTNINIDLMSAIPGQNLKSYEETLRKVIKLDPSHISAYSLILEEGTPFFERYKKGNDLPNEDEEREMYYMTKNILKEAGFLRYEISNYSKQGFECKHNLGYWRRVPYIGFGVAAASLYKEKRYMMHGDIQRFIDRDFSEEVENLSIKDAMEEFMILGLRCTSGVSRKDFFDTFNTDIDNVYRKELDKLSKEGLLVNSDRIFLTDRGLDVANYCMSEFVGLKS